MSVNTARGNTQKRPPFFPHGGRIEGPGHAEEDREVLQKSPKSSSLPGFITRNPFWEFSFSLLYFQHLFSKWKVTGSLPALNPLPQGFSQTGSLTKKFQAEHEPLSLEEKREAEPTLWFSFWACSQLGNQRRKNTWAGAGAALGSAEQASSVPVLEGWFLRVRLNSVSLRRTKDENNFLKNGQFFLLQVKNYSSSFGWFSLPGL